VGVRLLFDENLSARLVRALAAEFPRSTDVISALGPCPSDEAIWRYASTEGMVIVTKDEDFQRFSVWRGFPPKVIWIRLGNASTEATEALLRTSVAQIEAFVAHPDAAFLPLGRVPGDA
jgi:predicted nuclease of predicted toxin-antitoxin system